MNVELLENMPLTDLYELVRKKWELLKDERIKPRLRELATYIPENQKYPLLFATARLIPIYSDEYVEYMAILLENGANPNLRYYWASGTKYDTILDALLSSIADNNESTKLTKHHKKALMLLIHYGMRITFSEAWYHNEVGYSAIHFCRTYEAQLDELSCKQVDDV